MTLNLVDSSVIVAYYHTLDAQHEKATHLGLGKDVAVNELLFAEIANVLERRIKDSDRVIRALKELREHMVLQSLPTGVLEGGLVLFEKHVGRLSFTDCVLLFHCKQLQMSLVTFDETLRKVAIQEGLTVIPN